MVNDLMDSITLKQKNKCKKTQISKNRWKLPKICYTKNCLHFAVHSYTNIFILLMNILY